MARSTEPGGARSVLRAAARLDEINREVAEILRVFPDLRASGQRHPRRPKVEHAACRVPRPTVTLPRQIH